MNGFEKRAEMKKQDILDSSKKLIIANGPSNVTIKDIARLAKVSPVTIFKFFDTKEKLVEETLIDHFRNYMIDIEKIVRAKDSFQNKLKQALIYKSNVSKELNEEIYQIYAEYIASGNERFIAFMNHNKELTSEIFIQGKQEGAIDSNISNKALELYMDLIMQSISSKENITKIKPIINEIMYLICYGFSGKSNNE